MFPRTLKLKKKFCYSGLHLAGFEPAASRGEADYESGAFDHLAIDALGKLFYTEPLVGSFS